MHINTFDLIKMYEPSGFISIILILLLGVIVFNIVSVFSNQVQFYSLIRFFRRLSSSEQIEKGNLLYSKANNNRESSATIKSRVLDIISPIIIGANQEKKEELFDASFIEKRLWTIFNINLIFKRMQNKILLTILFSLILGVLGTVIEYSSVIFDWFSVISDSSITYEAVSHSLLRVLIPIFIGIIAISTSLIHYILLKINSNWIMRHVFIVVARCDSCCSSPLINLGD